MQTKLLTVLFTALTLAPAATQAAPIVVTAIDPGNGTQLSFVFDPAAGENTDGDNTYLVGYRADFTSFVNNGSQDYLAGIDFRLNAAAALSSYTVESEPVSAGDWTYYLDRGLNGNDPCKAQGNPDDVLCGEQTLFAFSYPSLTNGLATTGVYDWTFTLTYAGPLAFPDVMYGARIRAVFGFVDKCTETTGTGRDRETTEVDCFNYQGLSSLTTPSDGGDDGGDGDDGGSDGGSAPEPGILLMFGAGLLGLAAKLRKV